MSYTIETTTENIIFNSSLGAACIPAARITHVSAAVTTGPGNMVPASRRATLNIGHRGWETTKIPLEDDDDLVAVVRDIEAARGRILADRSARRHKTFEEAHSACLETNAQGAKELHPDALFEELELFAPRLLDYPDALEAYMRQWAQGSYVLGAHKPIVDDVRGHTQLRDS